jgi:hypothetical protein
MLKSPRMLLTEISRSCPSLSFLRRRVRGGGVKGPVAMRSPCRPGCSS